MGGELTVDLLQDPRPVRDARRRGGGDLAIELFTGIALLIQRDPIITAKEAASIDLISGGRFVFGVGAGWNIEELRDHGTDPKTRGALLDERIEAIKALWTTEPAEYHGKYVDFDPVLRSPQAGSEAASADLHRRRLGCHRQAGDPPRCRLDLQPAARGAADQTHRSDP